MRPKELFIILILSFILIPGTPALAEEVTVDDILKQIICPAGMDMVMSVCYNPDIREPIVFLINQKLAQGESQQEILDYFVAQYGEQVLVSPPKKGFNLVLWVLAPVAILVGGVVIYLAVKAWVRRGRQPPGVTKAEEEDEEYHEQLEKELAEFSEMGFR